MRLPGYNSLLLLLLLLSPLLAGATDAKVAKNRFRVAIYYPQVPPYMYADGDNLPRGVVPEVLNAFFSQQPFQLEYVFENRQRAELGVYSGKYDATILAPKWTENPAALVFSDPIVEHRDFLYALTPLPAHTLQNLSGQTICLRRYYKYTAFSDELDNGNLIRLDADSEFDQFNMLANGRCELAYMNEHVATWLTNNHFSHIDFYRTHVEADKAGLTLALHPKWEELTLLLNNHIHQAQQNGTIDSSLDFHMQKQAR